MDVLESSFKAINKDYTLYSSLVYDDSEDYFFYDLILNPSSSSPLKKISAYFLQQNQEKPVCKNISYITTDDELYQFSSLKDPGAKNLHILAVQTLNHALLHLDYKTIQQSKELFFKENNDQHLFYYIKDKNLEKDHPLFNN
jgi:hypothetical protein